MSVTLETPFLTAEQLRRIRDNIPQLSNRPDGNVDLGLLLNTAIATIKTDLQTLDDGLVVQEITGTIAFAAVRTMFATPVEVIPAPGAGLYNDVIDCYWFLDYSGVAYDAAVAGDALTLKYTDASGAQVVDSVAGNAIGSAAADYHTLQRRVPELIPVANAAVVAHILLTEWFAAAGTSPLKYAIRYVVRTFQT